MARTMPRLRLLCCSLVTTEVGEYEGGIYDRHVCDRECGGCFTAHLCDVVALLRGGRARGGNRHDRDLRARYEERFEVEDSDEWMAAMAEYNREADAITAALFRAEGEPGLAHLYFTDRRAFDRRMERGRHHFFGPPSGAHASADDDHVEGDHHREHEQRDLNPLGEAVAMLTPLRSG